MSDISLPEDAFVEVVYSPRAREVVSLKVEFAELYSKAKKTENITVKDVLLCCPIFVLFPELVLDALDLGIWGGRTTLSTVIKPGDRIEIYRALLVDPKEARRLRHKKQAPKKALYRPSVKSGQ